MSNPSRRHPPAAPLLAAALLLPALLLPALAAAAPAQGAKSDEPRHLRHMVFVGEGGEGGEEGFVMARPFLGGGFLGVELLRLTPELRAHFGAPEDAGVMIARVLPDSPAAQAGLQVGDVITRIDGKTVASAARLGAEVRRREDGERVSLDVYRQGRLQEFTVTIQERERQALDVGQFFEWQGEGEGEDVPLTLRVAPRIHLRDLPEIDPEVWQNLEERLEGMDWEGMTQRIQVVRPELEKRLQELEKRLQELEKELEEATREKP